MMDIYMDNVILECNTPDIYKLKIFTECTLYEVRCQEIALTKFDTGYLLRVSANLDYARLETARVLKLYQDDQEILIANKVEMVTKERQHTYRFFCRIEEVAMIPSLLEKQREQTREVIQKENALAEAGMSYERVAALSDKYFGDFFKKDNNSLLLERRKMRRKQFSGTTEPATTNILADLENMIGLNAVKTEIKKMVAMEMQREFLNSIGMKEKPNDMLFLGNPGTGKTTVARYLTEVLYKMGKLRENKCVEINGHDLMGGYVGQTASTVDKYLQEARGGVLFIDEAYSLLDGANSFASDAITKLLGALTKPNRDFVCILAGYEDEMKELMSFNAGFESRIGTKLYFEDYTVEELGEIFCSLIKTYGYAIETPALTEVLAYFSSVKDTPKFSNGRFVRNLFEKMEEEHCKRFDGTDSASDVLRQGDLTEEIKQQLAIGIM